jgi:hypothetical protein
MTMVGLGIAVLGKWFECKQTVTIAHNAQMV